MKYLAILCILYLSLTSCFEGNKSSETTNSRELITEHDANPVIGTAETIALKNGYLNLENVTKPLWTKVP